MIQIPRIPIGIAPPPPPKPKRSSYVRLVIARACHFALQAELSEPTPEMYADAAAWVRSLRFSSDHFYEEVLRGLGLAALN